MYQLCKSNYCIHTIDDFFQWGNRKLEFITTLKRISVNGKLMLHQISSCLFILYQPLGNVLTVSSACAQIGMLCLPSCDQSNGQSKPDSERWYSFSAVYSVFNVSARKAYDQLICWGKWWRKLAKTWCWLTIHIRPCASQDTLSMSGYADFCSRR